MPCFEYKCDCCKQITEKLEAYSASTSRDCEFCKAKNAAHRIISQTSFALDKSGWYKESYTAKR